MNNYLTQITRKLVKLGGLATLINFLNPLSTSGAQIGFDVIVKNEKVGSLGVSATRNNTRLESNFLVTKNNWSLTQLASDLGVDHFNWLQIVVDNRRRVITFPKKHSSIFNPAVKGTYGQITSLGILMKCHPRLLEI